MEATRRPSLADEEAHRIKAIESAVGASRSIDVAIAGGTADSNVDTVDTTEGVQITEIVGSEESNQPAC